MKRTNVARRNSVKHGIFTELLLAGTAFGEEEQHLLDLIAAVGESIRPADSLEQILVDKLAALLLRQTRVYKAYQTIAPKMFARVDDTLNPEQPPPALHLISRADQIVVDRKDPSFDLIVRYEIAIDRQFTRVLDQIRQVRLMRDPVINL
jgi:hypothetical protein